MPRAVAAHRFPATDGGHAHDPASVGSPARRGRSPRSPLRVEAASRRRRCPSGRRRPSSGHKWPFPWPRIRRWRPGSRSSRHAARTGRGSRVGNTTRRGRVVLPKRRREQTVRRRGWSPFFHQVDERADASASSVCTLARCLSGPDRRDKHLQQQSRHHPVTRFGRRLCPAPASW